MRRRHSALGLFGIVPLLLGGCGDGGTADVGQAGDKARAARVVEIRQLDTHRFEPATVEAKPGETITFRVTNGGSQIHEFFIGDDKAHKARDEEMRSMGSTPMQMRDMPNSLTIDPGATEELAWTFPQKGSVPFGCHEPGHFEDGMKGTVKIG